MGSSRAFVAPTDFGSHSMLHQTLTPSSSSSSCLFAFNTSSSSSPSASFPLPLCHLQAPALTLAFSHCSQVDKEERMETVESALKGSCLRPEMFGSGPHQQHQQQSHGVLADDERVSLAGDGFSVDDLLDLEEFSEPEKEAERGGKEEAEAGEALEAENSINTASSSSSSALSFEPLPPPSEIPLPAHDAEELEWVSLYMDDSLSEFAPPCSAAALPPPEKAQVPAAPKVENRLGSALPSPAPCALSTEALVPVKAKRSKRSRSASAAAWSLSGPTPFADSSSSSTATATSSSSSSASSSPFSSFLFYDASATAHLLDENDPQTKKHKPKKRGRKPKNSPANTTSAAWAAAGELRCTHCGAQKTPQWRAGPLGAKTLCNACGVRYKSGRLLPEYRPACSPTFVSSVHSNSHRKVLEMRRKKEAEILSAATPPVPSY